MFVTSSQPDQLMRANSHSARRLGALIVASALLATSAIAQVEWREIPLLLNGGAHRSAMAFDAARGRIVLLVSHSFSGLAETWEWDGTAWTRLLPLISPPSGGSQGIAYDSSRRRVVLFSTLGGTWEWDGTNWTQALPTTTPTPRTLHAITFDSWRNRTVLFGGAINSGGALQADTWEWDGTNWVQASPSTSPPARGGHSLAFDSRRGRIVLFGGFDVRGGLRDTWEWDGTNWLQQTPAVSPTFRDGCGLAFDSNRGVTVLAGGDRFQSDHWEWDGTTWTQRTTLFPPLRRVFPAMAYDAARQRVVMFGGYVWNPGPDRNPSDTLEYDGTSWVQHAPTNPDAEIEDLVFDYVQRKVVGFSNVFQEASSWDGTAWVRTQPTRNIPTGIQGGTLASDPVRGRVVYFGGKDSAGTVLYDLTWEWDGTGWSQRFPTNKPSPRSSVMSYHLASQRVVLFGGVANGLHLGDTWEWSGVDWAPRSPVNAPSARSGHAMVDDELRGVVILHGGEVGGTVLQDTWEWNGANWSLRTAAGPQLLQPRMVHDRARERIVLNGGNSSTGVGETWEWDGMAWTQRLTATPRSWWSLAHDPVRRVTVLYAEGPTWEYGPTTPATFASYGNGCPGSAGTPTLVAADLSLPWIGDTLTLRLTNLPATAPGTVLVGESNTVWGSVGLPFDLGFLGMPGCPLLTPPTLLVPVTASNGIATLGLPIPNIQRFVGGRFYCQGLVLDLPANALGVTVSNGGASRIGGR